MSLKAEILKTNDAKKRTMLKEAKLILSRIDDDIKNAYDHDRTNVAVTVPITFSIPHVANSDAQRFIYYAILESLISRDFDVQIHFAADQTIFYIKWMSDEETREIEKQNELLAKYTMKITEGQIALNKKP